MEMQSLGMDKLQQREQGARDLNKRNGRVGFKLTGSQVVTTTTTWPSYVFAGLFPSARALARSLPWKLVPIELSHN